MHDRGLACQLCRGVWWIPSGGTPLCNGVPAPDTVTHITYTSGLCGGVGQAFVTCLVYPRGFGNSVDRRVREDVGPCGGTGFKIVVHHAGARRGIGAGRHLSTGRPVQGRRVDKETRGLPAPDGGVRFGVYTGPMATQATSRWSSLSVSTAPVGPVGR